MNFYYKVGLDSYGSQACVGTAFQHFGTFKVTLFTQRRITDAASKTIIFCFTF